MKTLGIVIIYWSQWWWKHVRLGSIEVSNARQVFTCPERKHLGHQI